MWLKKLVATSLVVCTLAMVGIIVVGVSQGDSSNNRISIFKKDKTSQTSIKSTNGEAAPANSSSSSSTSQNSSPGESSAPTNEPSNSQNTPGTSSAPSSSTPASTTSTGTTTSNPTTASPTTPSTPATPKPVINLTVSPGSITTGGSATIGWSATNNPSSCTASGSWSGAKAASGTQSTGAVSTAGAKTYSLSCVNAGGTATTSVNLTVNAAPVVYCGGQTPCYGNSDMTAHNSQPTCWGYTKHNRSGAYASVFNINAASPGSKISTSHGLKNISSSNFYSHCGGDITACVNGSGGCSAWRNHSSGNMSSYSQTFIGYFDPAKP